MAMSRNRLRALIAVVIVAPAILAGAFLFLLSEQCGAPAPAEPEFEVADVPFAAPSSSRVIPSGRTMPLYLQDDPQWASLPYAGDTIGNSGCGLACAAMTIEYLTTQRADPRILSDVVGSECLTDGVNDPGKFCAWIAEHYPTYNIHYSGIYFNAPDALEDVRNGKLVFASLTGYFGDQFYDGHIVLLWKSDDSGIWVRDPKSGANSQSPLTEDDFYSVQWVYFYSIWGGNYDTLRH